MRLVDWNLLDLLQFVVWLNLGLTKLFWDLDFSDHSVNFNRDWGAIFSCERVWYHLSAAVSVLVFDKSFFDSHANNGLILLDIVDQVRHFCQLNSHFFILLTLLLGTDFDLYFLGYLLFLPLFFCDFYCVNVFNIWSSLNSQNLGLFYLVDLSSSVLSRWLRYVSFLDLNQWFIISMWLTARWQTSLGYRLAWNQTEMTVVTVTNVKGWREEFFDFLIFKFKVTIYDEAALLGLFIDGLHLLIGVRQKGFDEVAA